MSKLAVQLYTVREEASRDFIGTLEKVAQLGYEGVEFAGFFGTTAKVLKVHLERLGLTAVGSHTSLEDLTDRLEEVIAYNKVIGNKYIICPWSDIKDKESLETVADTLRKAAHTLIAHDMMLLYHNHDHEFKEIEGSYILNQLFETCKGLGAEIDTFWVHRAGVDVKEYLLKHRDIVKLIHLKDGTTEHLTAIGEGTAPIGTVMEVAKTLELEWVIVENDTPTPNGLEDIERSIKYIKANF